MRDYEECRPYVDHLLAEHRRLHRLLGQTRAAIVGSGCPDRDATWVDVKRVLLLLRNELAQHFAEEEAGGCLDEAVSRCPRLSGEARRLEADHTELLAEIDRLIAQAEDHGCHVEDRVAFEAAFDNLCRELHAHENAENQILKQGFGANLNGDEEGRPTLTLDF
jgi:hypothetical protein